MEMPSLFREEQDVNASVVASYFLELEANW
jgi:hypothetical protein